MCYVENTEIQMTSNLGSRSAPKNNKIIIIITIITNSSIIISSNSTETVNMRIKVITRHVCVTIVGVEKQ